MDVSTHSDYADYEWAIIFNRACLNILGIWPESNANTRRKFMADIRVIIILTLIIWSTVIPSLHSVIRIRNNIMSVIDNLQYTLPILIATTKLVLMWRKKKVLLSILQMIKDDWTKCKSEREKDIMIKWARITRAITICSYFMVLFSFVLVVIFPSLGISFRYLTNITDPGKVMPLQTYYIYNVSKNPFYEMTYVLQGFSVITAASTYTGTDTFMGFLVFHVCGQLENLKARIFHHNKFNDFNDNLPSIVQDHMRLIRCVKAIDDTFNLMLLGLLIYFGILFALYGFLFTIIISQNRDSSVSQLILILTAFGLTFTHMCLYCIIGEILIIRCDGIYEAICQSKWYKMKSQHAKNLLTILAQSNKPLQLTAGRIFPMTMATFCNLLKTSGGYISVLLAHRE